VLWVEDPLAGINRHFDSENRAHPRPLTPPPDRVLEGHRRKADLQKLVTGVVVTPWASTATFDETNQLLQSNGYTIPVHRSELTRYREFLPGPERIAPR
jgi:hypothetical protein